MATGKITKRTVDALLANAVTGFLWDEDLKGFGLKITSAGSASYVVQYRMGGREAKTRRYTIGGHGSPWTPSTAREEAARMLFLVAQGKDPVEADKQRRREAVDLAFSNYADRFAASCRGKGWTTLVKRSLRLHVKPVLRDKALPTIARSDIVDVFDGMPAEQIGNRRNVFAVLRRLFKWAISRGDIASSPMEGMETPPPVKPRERWLSDDELRRVWTHAPLCHRCFGPIVRLLIATGQRREEIAGLQWEELNRADREMRLSGDRTKNGEPTSVPLNDLAVAELDMVARSDRWPKRGRVFPTSSGAAFTAYHKGKTKLDRLIAEDGGEPVAPWRLHDLRRTLATGFQRLGVRFEVTEAVLNHVGASRSGVAAIYQRHDWKPEKREALNAWNDHIVKSLAAAATGS
ncbi:tyrosine-type recombinase/integrase [Sphingomonas canadensis]|uniref:Tyrosine-type recombinase/integrase n=1 Tax=Sphingomonas canadensis TaxID=1219257 RepID=A0ABW3HD23_9SPHN|nr:site-specific integrase [Sphingomonas canadensis]MCW3838143.1 integrase arm-type DNA-binding domain-containing protein [Sphingomonas canadensis]